MTDPKPFFSKRGSCSGVSGLTRELMRGLNTLIARGNARQLIVRSADDRTLLRLPVTIAVLLGALLLWQAAPLVIVAVIVALALKVQFIVASDKVPAPPGDRHDG